MPDRVFRDRREAGRVLTGLLDHYQLVRERHPGDCRLIGFTTHRGTVTAADDREDPGQRKLVRPALAGSVEEPFHEVGGKAFLVRPGIATGAARRSDRRAGSGRSASSTDRRPSGRATTSGPAWPTSSTP
jgi:erythromycin esterase-like protein